MIAITVVTLFVALITGAWVPVILVGILIILAVAISDRELS